MKANGKQITLESQDELNKLYSVINYSPISDSLGFDGWWKELRNERTEDYNKYHEKLQKLFYRRNGMIKKFLHRITLVWCIYGLYLLLKIGNPFIFKTYNLIGNKFDFNQCNTNDCVDYIVVYFWFILVGIGMSVSLYALNHFSDWFFNHKK